LLALITYFCVFVPTKYFRCAKNMANKVPSSIATYAKDIQNLKK
jgi:hypothetical protein